jgi:outer membrane protein assembly factor BamB
MSNPSSQLRTLDWARPLIRVAAAALVLIGLAGVVAGYLLPWSRFDPAGGNYPPVALRGAIAVLGPGLSVLAVVLRAVWVRRVAALGALAVAAFGVLQLITISRTQGYGPGGPLTILGALALAGGWLAGGPPVRATDRAGIQRVPGIIVLIGGAVLVGSLGWSGQHWFTEGRFVDATTAPARSGGPTGAPEGLAQQRWQRTLAADQLVGLVGRVLVVRDGHGVRALDAATGRERWHYLRSDLATANAAPAGDGRSVLLFYAQGRGVLAVSLEAATGHRRWVAQLDAPASDGWGVGTLVPAGPGVAAVELGGAHPARLVSATSAGSGSRAPKLPSGQPCTVSAVAAAAGTLAVALRCGADDSVVGVSAADGRQRWVWHPPYPDGYSSAEPLELTGAGTGVLVAYGESTRTSADGDPVAVALPRTGQLLDPATGQEGPAYRVTGRLLAAGAGTAVYLDGAAVGVELATGKVHWSTPLTVVAGFHPAAAAIAGGVAWLAFRGTPDSGRVNGDGGPLAVVALNLTTGQVTASRVLPADLSTCRPGTDGRTLCGQRPATVVAGAGVLVLAEQRDSQLALTALA